MAARKRGDAPKPQVVQHTEESAREKAIDLAVAAIEQQFGKGSIRRMDGTVEDMEHFSSGSPSIDIALGIGGFPRGRIIEIYGPESSGKTTLALHAIAEIGYEVKVAWSGEEAIEIIKKYVNLDEKEWIDYQ